LLIITFNQRAKMSHIRELLNLLTSSNIKIQGINYSFDDNFDTNTGMYIGSYTYQKEKYPQITDELLKTIKDTKLSKKEFINFLKNHTSNANP
ncbi:MAG TPA: hypothetical protein PK957_03455, partial [Candidatus Dojkabacteria bacterium]|nr:hypothetical protein [Candidatus Dojkabacteria bacterium]